MRYKITRIWETADQKGLHVDVEFLDETNQVVGRNDFLMYNVRATSIRYIGREGPDGEILDPDQYEEVQTDVRAAIVANIEAYIDRQPALLQRDERDLRLQPSDTNRLGLRTKSGVPELIGETRTR